MASGLFFSTLTIFSFFWHKLKIQFQEITQNTTNPGEPTQPEWNPRNNAHIQSIHPRDNQVTPGHHKASDPPPHIKLNSLRTFCRPHLGPFPNP